ncbi:MAG: hypothetical protein HYR66_01185 [Sphingobacteriales bacterium]|nr:hypothetical protein [Sphingobacteriales bacterium]MBI3719750.1 hypothetical protein [Sphingobacteriales bacterium]
MVINSTTLPNGFTVKKNATATALGTDTSLNGINIPGAWKQTGRGF